MLAAGIEANAVASFEPARFSERLRPLSADFEAAAGRELGGYAIAGRKDRLGF